MGEEKVIAEIRETLESLKEGHSDYSSEIKGMNERMDKMDTYMTETSEGMSKVMKSMEDLVGSKKSMEEMTDGLKSNLSSLEDLVESHTKALEVKESDDGEGNSSEEGSEAEEGEESDNDESDSNADLTKEELEEAASKIGFQLVESAKAPEASESGVTEINTEGIDSEEESEETEEETESEESDNSGKVKAKGSLSSMNKSLQFF